MYQNQYWKEMYKLKFHTTYIDVYKEKTEKIDRNINIFLAATSSSCICGWAIWNDLSFIWSIIIALSQLITAVKMFLPYKNRLKKLSPLLNELEDLCIKAESVWYNVSEGEMTQKEIHDLRIKLKKNKSDILQKYLGKNSLSHNKKYIKIASQLTKEHIEYMYH